MAGEHRIEVVLSDDAIEQLDELRGCAPPVPYGSAGRFTAPRRSRFCFHAKAEVG
jgi:hypothetical protein